MNKHTKLRALEKTLIFSIFSTCFGVVQASAVIPPPLPTASHMVRESAGMNQDEVKRNQRAHHHNKHHKKNITRDDTLDDAPSKTK